MADLGAILTAIVTPFDDDLRVDEEAFVDLLRHLCAHGSDGVVVCGTTGEAPTLSDDEHLRLVELAVQERPDGATVVAGTGSNDTHHACMMTGRATELGVDAVLSVTPYYNKPNRRGLRRHFEEVARATDRPVILYNIPGRTALDMPNDVLAELAQIERVDYVKQANNENLAPVDGLGVYAGNDDILARTLDIGGVGGDLGATPHGGGGGRDLRRQPHRRRGDAADGRRARGALADRRLAARRLRRDVGHDEPDPGQGGAEHARPPRRRAGARPPRR